MICAYLIFPEQALAAINTALYFASTFLAFRTYHRA